MSENQSPQQIEPATENQDIANEPEVNENGGEYQGQQGEEAENNIVDGEEGENQGEGIDPYGDGGEQMEQYQNGEGEGVVFQQGNLENQSARSHQSGKSFQENEENLVQEPEQPKSSQSIKSQKSQKSGALIENPPLRPPSSSSQQKQPLQIPLQENKSNRSGQSGGKRSNFDDEQVQNDGNYSQTSSKRGGLQNQDDFGDGGSSYGNGDDLGEGNEEFDDQDMIEHRPISAAPQIQDNMTLYQQQEAKVIQWCNQNGSEWVDNDFPPDFKSLYRDPLNPPEWAREVRQVTWMRPKQIAKDAKFMIDRQGDAKQGAFGESWFIGAIIIVATRGDLLEKLFVEVEHFEDMGFCTFQFFKNGEWKQVMVDTLLPYDTESKQILYTYCMNTSEFWIPLMEKAYSKLHGCYENICDGTILEGLVDLTGGVSEGWQLNDPETSKLIENNQLWQMMMSYFHQQFYLGCINFVEGKNAQLADTGTHGIFENHHYGICDIREFPQENLKLVRIRNPWGVEGGWNGAFCDDSEEWDKHRNLREELKLVFKTKKSDGTWWMSFNEWYVHFNKLFVCKVFPQSWESYSIESNWQGKTNGGVCPPRSVYDGPDPVPEYLQLETDEKWFNNPQFRVKVNKETKMYVSLMLQDEKLTKVTYVACNFMVISSRSRRNRVWERPINNDIVIEANPAANLPAQREITQYFTLQRFPTQNYGYYIIVPNIITESKKEEKRNFFLRVFSSDPIEIVEMPETIEVSQEGQWAEHNSGGKRKLEVKIESKGTDQETIQKQFEYKNNPQWCRNPQYFLNLAQPTHLKIILRKMGNVRKTRGIKIGMTICRFDNPNNAQNQVQAKVTPLQQNSKGGQLNNLDRLLQQTSVQLEPPQMQYTQRKLTMGFAEKFQESSYAYDEVAALYFFWNPTEGPFIIIPSLAEEDKQSTFKMTIFSNNPVELQKLQEKQNAVHIGSWVQDVSDGGCHLMQEPYEKEASKQTWTQNPKFTLKFEEGGSANLKVTLAIAEKNWKAKTKNTVGGMIGIYLLEKSNKISLNNSVREPNFLPVNQLSEEYVINDCGKSEFYIMPCTYQPKIVGNFILAVSSNKEFTLKEPN